MVTSGGVRQYDTGGGAGGGLDESAAEAAWPRLAVRHWLDPHPDAASFDETWEFSTTGDMTQGELETAGWTFVSCTGEVANGIFWLTASSGSPQFAHAYLTTNFAGDFDFVFPMPTAPPGYDATPDVAAATFYNPGIVFVGDTTNNVGRAIATWGGSTNSMWPYWYTGNLTGSINNGGTEIGKYFTSEGLLRISRTSGTIYRMVSPSPSGVVLRADETAAVDAGWRAPKTDVDANTYDRVGLSFYDDPAEGAKIGLRFIRRFQ